MNEINPLFEAMSNIDDNIVSEAVKTARKRPKGIRAALIAAAAAAFCAVTAVAAAAALKAPKEVTINDVPVEPRYSTFTDDLGEEWELYVFEFPDFALGEEIEGYTAVGDIKVVRNPEYPDRWGEWMMVDEAGNKFYTGVNNKLVKFQSKDGVRHGGFEVANFLSDRYTYLEFAADDSRIEIVLLPHDQADAYLEQKGYFFPEE
ncbi:MAG: hypothetical protein NC299_00745 [Lachnospiraceae bacterium]|nr:hypothetical protein [Ruminococcus sp.]MCM1273875.1 hypothetical protein [Lachnospiraceae bacterium]